MNGEKTEHEADKTSLRGHELSQACKPEDNLRHSHKMSMSVPLDEYIDEKEAEPDDRFDCCAFGRATCVVHQKQPRALSLIDGASRRKCSSSECERQAVFDPLGWTPTILYG